jgi:DNA-binding transcriptional MocR family regulator
MEAAMKKLFPESAAFQHARGGFFLWVELSPGSDSEALLKRAVEREKVAFVAGPPFFADGSGKQFMRLSFSYVAEERIDEAIERLARAIGAC